MPDPVNVTSPSLSPTFAPSATMSTLSPEALLAFLGERLNDIDTQIGDQMKQQTLMMRERQAVQAAQSALNLSGADGPTDGPAMSKVLDAFNQAIAQLDSTDPVSQQLSTFRDSMVTQYGYEPPSAPTPAGSPVSSGHGTPTTLPVATAAPTLNKPPQAKDWQATGDALGNIADGIKSSSDIQMLQLQDLISQRQQAVELCNGMMGKEDQTLEDQAKAIGR
jgi:hypothetical protein